MEQEATQYSHWYGLQTTWIWSLHVRDEVRIIIPIFIDDITFASSNPAAIDSAIQELASHFKLRDLGPTSFLLGIEIIRNPATQQYRSPNVSIY